VPYQWKHGVLFPRWNRLDQLRLRRAALHLLSSLSWILGAALSLILPISWVPAAFILLAQTLAGISAFFLLRRLTGKTAACLGSAFYAANPYALLVSYVRSDFAEQLACAIFPVLLLAATAPCRVAQGRKVETFPDHFVRHFLRRKFGFATPPPASLPAIPWRFYSGGPHLRNGHGDYCLAASSVLRWALVSPGFLSSAAAYEQRWVNIGQALSSGLLPAENFLFTQIADVEHTWFNWISSLCCPRAHSADGAYSFRFAAVLPRRGDFNRSKGVLGQRLARPRIGRYRHDVAADSPSLNFCRNAFRAISVALDVHRRRGLLVFSGCCNRTAPRLALVVLVAILLFPLGYFLTQTPGGTPMKCPLNWRPSRLVRVYEGVDEYDPLGDDHLDLPKHAPVAKSCRTLQ